MKQTLAKLFSSTKFIVMVAAIIAYITARAGWDVSQDEAQKVLLFVAVWLGAAGATDFGKAAAAAAAPPPGPRTSADTQAQPAKPDVTTVAAPVA